MPIVPKETHLDYLMRIKWPEELRVIKGRPHSLNAVIGEGDESIYETMRLTYRRQLEALSDEELRVMFQEEKDKENQGNAKSKAAREARLFFNLDSSNADFDFWAKAPYWTLEESIALSFGKSPEIVNWKTIEKYAAPRYEAGYRQPTHPSPFAIEYLKRLELAGRAVRMKQLHDPMTPGLFIAWIQRHEMSFPDELPALVEKYGGNIMDWKTAYNTAIAEAGKTAAQMQLRYDELAEQSNQREKALQEENQRLQNALDEVQADVGKPKSQSKRERDTLLKIIIGFAIKGYGYDPKKARTSTPKEFANDLDDLGIPVSDDTIRSKLIEAAELLPASDA